MADELSPSAKGEPEQGVARLLFKLRQGGTAWIWRRLKSEWLLPTTGPGRAAHHFLRAALATGRRLFPAREEADDTLLYAFYDFKVQPVTFDVLWFLCGADFERRRRGLAGVHVVLVPGPSEGLREEDAAYEETIDKEARRWRVHNLILSCLPLLPSLAGYTMAPTRRHASALHGRVGERIYPLRYEPALPISHHPTDCLEPARAGERPIAVLRANGQALRYVDQWLAARCAGRRIVVITLRQYNFNRARNSDLAAWVEFAQGLDSAFYCPVFVPDTETSLDGQVTELSDFAVFTEAAWNIALRMALYERAWVNLGVNNGPMGLCWLNEATRYVTFKMVTKSAAQATEAYNRWCGFVPHESLPFATAMQKWCWDDDRSEIIGREFAAINELIELAQRCA